jgi:acetyl esterase
VTRRDAAPFDWLNGDVGVLRRQYERCFAAADPGGESWKTILHADGGLRLLVQQPARLAGADHAILYVHGGGWIVGSPLTHADISGALAEGAGMTVYSVDYRLAPEHPAPAPVVDGCRALSALLQPGEIEGIVLCGDSAGAAIALAVERRADAALHDRIRGVCAFYGGFGLGDTPAVRAFGARADGLDAACLERFWSLANDPRLPSPYSIDALGQAPGAPVYLLAGSRDPLRDDTLALAAAYRACGRPHDLDLVESAGHGFLHDAGASPAATAAIGRVSTWIRSATSGCRARRP